MILEIEKVIRDSGVLETLDALEVGFLNLANGEIEKFLYTNVSDISLPIAFDLASITKVLTNGLMLKIDKKAINSDLKLCLEHCSGVPAWGYLSKRTWERDISRFKIKASEPIYSDYGAIRAQLIFEESAGLSLYDEASKIWDDEVFHWTDRREQFHYLNTGIRNKSKIFGVVHDPNAFNLKAKVSHAGLFATTNGLLKTIYKVFNDKVFSKSLMDSKKKNDSTRFHYGWDTPQGEDSLAGRGQSEFCFGHLGFTGTSVWVDLKSSKAISILSNATRDGWYNKDALNTVRRKVNTMFWRGK